MTFQLWSCFIFSSIMGVSRLRNPSTDHSNPGLPPPASQQETPHTHITAMRTSQRARNVSRALGKGEIQGQWVPVFSQYQADPMLVTILAKGDRGNCLFGLKGGFASTDLLFTQKCSARPPGSTRLSFRDIIKSSARGLSSHKVDVRTRCHTNAPASPPRHPATTHG